MQKVIQFIFIVIISLSFNYSIYAKLNNKEIELETQPAEYFDTPEKRAKWWNDLEDQWKWAFNRAVLEKGSVLTQPIDRKLIRIFQLKELEVVGKKGHGSTLDFKLNNLSGLKHLTNLEGVESLTNLTNLRG